MKIKYLFAIILLAGLSSCTKDSNIELANNETMESTTRSSSIFNSLTIETIMDQDLETEPINGYNTNSNQLLPGAIVIYKTNEGRFGKLMVHTYGYNLKVEFVTYDYNGSVLISKFGYIINGTASVDLDTGTQGQYGENDIFWEQITSVKRQLTPLDYVAILKFI